MAEEAVDSFSLKDTFNKVNHWRHILMDISMIGMAVGAFVASGGTFGFVDPIVSWLKMHVSGIPMLFGSGAEFIDVAYEQAEQGVWYTGAEANHMGGHGMGETGYTPGGETDANKAADLWSQSQQEHRELMLAHE